MTSRARELGDRYNEWIERHEVAWELVMAALAFLFVVVGFLLDDATEARQDTTLLWAVDVVLYVIFLAEFSTRLGAAHSRRAYLRGHWIDAAALIPIPAIRALRLIRLVRLLRLVRAFSGVFRALSSLERFTAHRGLMALFISWLGVAVISATGFFLAESGRNEHVQSPVDALWWAVTTLTTVGYGDVFPVTQEGRVAGSALMIVGITLWAAITGTITSLLIVSGSASASIPEQIRQLSDLRQDDLISDEEYARKRSELLARM